MGLLIGIGVLMVGLIHLIFWACVIGVIGWLVLIFIGGFLMNVFGLNKKISSGEPPGSENIGGSGWKDRS